MTDTEQLAKSFAELNTRHAAEYIGLIWVKSAHQGAIVIEQEGGELQVFMPLHDNADAYKLACKGNLWHSDDVAQAYNHEAYKLDPEGEMRRVLTLVAATRQRRRMEPKQTMTVGRTFGDVA